LVASDKTTESNVAGADDFSDVNFDLVKENIIHMH
jgi:hypothetical protein